MVEFRWISLARMTTDPMIIVECPSGVRYRNVIGSTTRRVMEAEGILAPFLLDEEDRARLRDLPYPATRGLSSSMAAEIDNVLAAWPSSRFLSVDRERLLDSSKAWIWMRIDSTATAVIERYPEYQGSVYGFGLATGVLTWRSDS